MEISARFSPRSCFFSGESVRCVVEFSLPGQDRNISPAVPVTLAWASAQLQCECVTSDLDRRKRRLVAASNVTSLKASDWTEGAQLLSSAPKVGTVWV